MARLRSRGVSRVLTEVLIVVVVLAMASLFIAQQMGLLGSLGQNPTVDLSASQAYVNPVDGSGQILLKVRNSGTGTLRIKTIAVSGKEGAFIFFSGGLPKFNSTTTFAGASVVTGNFYTSAAGAGITSDGYLYIPGGAHVTLEFTFMQNLQKVFDAGSTYMVTVKGTGEVYSGKLTFSG